MKLRHILKRRRRLFADRPAAPRRGSALVAAVLFVVIFSLVVGYVLTASNRQTRNTHRSRLFTTSLAAAATTVKAMGQQAYFMATTRPAQLGGTFARMDEMMLGIQPRKVPGFLSMTKGGDDLTFFRAASESNGENQLITDPDDHWEGFYVRRWVYDAVAFMNAEDPDNPGELDPVAQRLGFQGAGFRTQIKIDYIPLFNYAIFYDGDLEIHNGPVMTVRGPVHTNQTLWVASGSGLSFHDRVSAAGSFRSYRDMVGVSGSSIARVNGTTNDNVIEQASHTADVSVYKRGGERYPDGTPKPAALLNINSGLGAMDTNANTFLDSLDNKWLDDAIARWAGNLEDQAMGVRAVRPPLPYVDDGSGGQKQADPIDLIQRADFTNDSADMRNSKMEYFADLVIEGNPGDLPTNPGSPSDWNSGVTIRQTIKNSDGMAVGYGPPIPNVLPGGNTPIVTKGTFYDDRQKQSVITYDVNVAELTARMGDEFYSGNGVLYLSTDGNPNGSTMNAVRITNASEVPESAQNTFTIASDRPVYVKGDLNTADKATTLLAGDAITILSNKWSDVNAKPGNNVPSASGGSTITNAILMLGQVASKYKDGSKDYDHYVPGAKRQSMSGGAHNVMRYLENWGGVTHTFNGSMICLFESRVATAQFWQKPNYYNPPNRQYNWDASLKNAVPPKGMPVLVEVTRADRLERVSLSEVVEMLN